jgi:hypothetical protein
MSQSICLPLFESIPQSERDLAWHNLNVNKARYVIAFNPPLCKTTANTVCSPKSKSSRRSSAFQNKQSQQLLARVRDRTVAILHKAILSSDPILTVRHVRCLTLRGLH